MLENVLSSIESVAADWEKDVAKRRRMTKVDPVADTLEYAASEIKETVERLREDCRTLTPEQYAELKGGGVTAQTVRNWIREHELEAYRGPRGWLIPASAARKKAS